MESVSMWLRLDRGASASLTAQLVEQLRDRVLAGELQPGLPLPSSRALAAEMSVSRSVVVRAYEQLNGEGYLETSAGSATRVAAGVTPTNPDPASSRKVALRRSTRGAAGGTEPPPDMKTVSTDPIDLRTGHPFLPATAPDDWRRALAAAAREPLRTHTADPLGDARLREQIAVHVARSRGVRCSAADVIVTAGTVDALLLVALSLGRDARWLVEDPGYAHANRVLRTAGAHVTPIAVSADGLRSAQLSTSAEDEASSPGTGSMAAVLVTPSHQFPLGGRMPAAERAALIDWAVRHDALIVEDDYDSEFRYVGAALPAVAALDPGGVVVHIGSLNKSFSPSLRLGYVVATNGSAIWERLASTKQVLGSNVSLPVQEAAATFFESGAFRRYVARARREYRHRRALLLEQFGRAGLGDRLSGLDGGLHAVLRLPARRTGAEIVGSLADRGVLVDAVAKYAELPHPDDSLAIGYGSEPTHRLERGLAEIARAILG